jgi:hypothetical protein
MAPSVLRIPPCQPFLFVLFSRWLDNLWNHFLLTLLTPTSRPHSNPPLKYLLSGFLSIEQLRSNPSPRHPTLLPHSFSSIASTETSMSTLFLFFLLTGHGGSWESDLCGQYPATSIEHGQCPAVKMHTAQWPGKDNPLRLSTSGLLALLFVFFLHLPIVLFLPSIRGLSFFQSFLSLLIFLPPSIVLSYLLDNFLFFCSLFLFVFEFTTTWWFNY